MRCLLHTLALYTVQYLPLALFFFFQRPTPFPPCGGGGGSLGDVLVLGPNSMVCQRYSRFVADLGTQEFAKLGSTKSMAACNSALSARSGKTRRYQNGVCCSLKIPPLSSVPAQCGGPPRANAPPPNPEPRSGFCTCKYSKRSWNGGFPFALQVSRFLQFERIILALRRAGGALYRSADTQV